MKKEIEEIRKLMTEVENRLQALEAKTEPERRLWSVDAICKKEGSYSAISLPPIRKLKLVADYCNERDKKGEWLYYPTWNIKRNDIGIHAINDSIIPCSHFNSADTLSLLISENTEFFEQLLKPKK